VFSAKVVVPETSFLRCARPAPPSTPPRPTHPRRYGPPIDGLRPGSLLVAAPGVDGPLFERAVVLVTETSGRGAKGVVLTQVRAPRPS